MLRSAVNLQEEASNTLRLRPELTTENVRRLYDRIKHCALESGLRYLPDYYRTLNEG